MEEGKSWIKWYAIVWKKVSGIEWFKCTQSKVYYKIYRIEWVWMECLSSIQYGEDCYQKDGLLICGCSWLLHIVLVRAAAVDVDDKGGNGDGCTLITFTPLTWPILVLPKASLNIGGCTCVAGCVCWCFNAFIRRLVTPTSRLRRGCSTGNTRRRFLGNFERA